MANDPSTSHGNPSGTGCSKSGGDEASNGSGPRKNSRLTRRRVLALITGAVAIGGGAWTLRPAPVSESPGWRVAPSLPGARGEMKATTLDGRIYVPGGLRGLGRSTNRLDIFDAVTEGWTTATGMPTGLNHHATATLDGTVYVLGGNADFGDPPGTYAFAYDPSVDEWRGISQLPDGRWGHEALAHDGRIFVLGGVPDGDTDIDTFIYDPVADGWERASPIPTRREHVAAASIDDALVVISGRWDGKNLRAVEAYDPAADAWESRATLPTPRSGFGAAVVEGAIYVVGGEDPSTLGGWTSAKVERYDPDTDSWEGVSDAPLAVHGHAVVESGGVLYVIGGAWRHGMWSVTAWSDKTLAFDPGELS